MHLTECYDIGAIWHSTAECTQYTCRLDDFKGQVYVETKILGMLKTIIFFQNVFIHKYFI